MQRRAKVRRDIVTKSVACFWIVQRDHRHALCRQPPLLRRDLGDSEAQLPREVARGGQPLSRLFDLDLCGIGGRTKYHLRELIYGVDPAIIESKASTRGADAHNTNTTITIM